MISYLLMEESTITTSIGESTNQINAAPIKNAKKSKITAKIPKCCMLKGVLPLTPRLFNEQIILVASLNVSCHGTPASLQFGRSTV
jgi:hypothetical protein